MIIVRTPKTTFSRTKVRKFDIRTDIEPEEIDLIDEENISADSLCKKAQENIEICNKRLERVRLMARAIECSANRNFQKLSTDMIHEKVNRTNGYYLKTIDSENGIFIH